MTFTRFCILLSLIVAPCSFSGEATFQPKLILPIGGSRLGSSPKLVKSTCE